LRRVSSRDELNRRQDLDMGMFRDHKPRKETEGMHLFGNDGRIGSFEIPTVRGVGELFGSSEALPDHSVSSGVVPDRFRAVGCRFFHMLPIFDTWALQLQGQSFFTV
jgi:hypothetical protein